MDLSPTGSSTSTSPSAPATFLATSPRMVVVATMVRLFSAVVPSLLTARRRRQHDRKEDECGDGMRCASRLISYLVTKNEN